MPWVAAPGYNLATGWGAPNIGEMAAYIDSLKSSSLGVNVSATVKGAASAQRVPWSVDSGVCKRHERTQRGLHAALSPPVWTRFPATVANVTLAYDSSTHLWSGTGRST